MVNNNHVNGAANGRENKAEQTRETKTFGEGAPQSSAELKEILTRHEAAGFLRICPRSLDKYVNQRLIPVARLGKRIVFRRSSLIAALERLEA